MHGRRRNCRLRMHGNGNACVSQGHATPLRDGAGQRKVPQSTPSNRGRIMHDDVDRAHRLSRVVRKRGRNHSLGQQAVQQRLGHERHAGARRNRIVQSLSVRRLGVRIRARIRRRLFHDENLPFEHGSVRKKHPLVAAASRSTAQPTAAKSTALSTTALAPAVLTAALATAALAAAALATTVRFTKTRTPTQHMHTYTKTQFNRSRPWDQRRCCRTAARSLLLRRRLLFGPPSWRCGWP